MKQRFLLFLCLCLFAGIKADAVEINGVNYNFSGDEAQVTYLTNSSYSGSVLIPMTVTYNGRTYNVTGIGSKAFYECKDLTSVTIPTSVRYIAYAAFCGCSSLNSVNIPSGVTWIGESAFAGCSSMEYVNISYGVTSIAKGAFAGCSSLSSVTIPSSIEIIEVQLFYGCTALTTVNIPKNVTIIGDEAFRGCSSLTYIDIPGSVRSIGKRAFESSGLTSVNIPFGVPCIDEYTFDNCSNLTSVIIPNSVTYISTWAFHSCSSLTSVTIPNSVTSIGYYAFSGCSSLTFVSISNNVTNIGEGAFSGCSNLTSIAIPNSVTNIRNYTFSNCSALAYVTIGKSVESIGDRAFLACTGLKEIYCYAEETPEVSYIAFRKDYYDGYNNHIDRSNVILAVPDDAVEKYKAHSEWGQFGFIIPFSDMNIQGVKDISELKNTKQYIIHTKYKVRGTLGVANGELASSNPAAVGHKCEEATPFAILQYDGNYYLYSTADRKFITNTGGETDAPGQNGTHAVTLTKNRNGFFMFSFTSTGNVLNVNNDPGIAINTWGQTEDKWDVGNQFTIAEAGDFDPTEAFEMLETEVIEVTNAQYLSAIQTIEANAQYCISTVYNDTRYYLTRSGYLTDAPTQEDCVFMFYRTEGNSLYCSPGWKLDACFSNPQLSNGATGDLYPQGHIQSNTDNRDNWEGQVWYLAANGRYAVRATNAISDEWGAGTYWTVLDTDNNGQPEADYSWTPVFVWQIENAQDFIDSIKDIEGKLEATSSFGDWYDLSGQKLSAPQRGINILRMSDGTTKKVLMK